MAEALTSVLVEQLATVFIKKIEYHVRLAVDAKDEIKKLQVTFKILQKVLNDAEKKQIKDESVEDWLVQFKDVAHDMDDIMDAWQTEILRSQIEGPPDENDVKYKQIKEKVSSYLCLPFSACFNKAALYYDMGSRIKEIRERLDSIHKEKDQFGFIISSNNTPFIQSNDDKFKPETSSIVNVSSIFGRESDKMIILNRLLGDSSNQLANKPYPGPHNIISIIGMGGLGKTTLTQLIIDDDQVKTHFPMTMWVCVSEPFDRTKVVQAIIREATKKSTDTSEWNPLHHELRDCVKEKRFLLVLDDVWTDKENDLNPLMDLLCHGAHGSRIIVTTRNESVAESMNSYQHQLGILSFDECWSLLCNKAFVGMRSKENEALKNISIEIAKKCKGLPLAASILGSLLRKKKTEKEWCDLLESEIWKLEEVEQDLFKPLLLSYNDLIPPLKRCFTYCAIFPKDHKIKKHILISLWIAQGFLNSTDPESLGEKYFDYLAERSFFQDFTKDEYDDGRIISCKMHDLVHDSAQFLTKNEFYMKMNSKKPLSNHSGKARHLTLICSDDEVETSFFRTSVNEANMNLRSLLAVFPTGSQTRDDLSYLFCRLRCLRVLKLKNLRTPNLSSEIKLLIHLRYLDLSYNESLIELPDSICSLHNLHTLKLKGCSALQKLPREMRKMIKLKHLDIRYTEDFSLPKGIGNLTSLLTLNKFVIGDSSGGCKISELKKLNLLQGNIDISGLGRLNTAIEASEAELNKKQGIHSLELDFNILDDGMASEIGDGELDFDILGEGMASEIDEGVEENGDGELDFDILGDGMASEIDEGVEKNGDGMAAEIDEGVEENLDATAREYIMEDVLGVLQPHPNLKKLKVNGYPGRKFPSWIASLTYLRSLSLSDSPNCTELPSLGLLPSLETLSLVGLNNLKHIGFEVYGGAQCAREVVFPKLIEFYFDSYNLEVWDIGDGKVARQIMPCVEKINLVSKKLKVLPGLGILQSLETLSIQGSEDVTHIGPEFYRVGDTSSGGNVNLTAFPNLKSLDVSDMEKLEEFDLGVDVGGGNQGETIVMPRLAHMNISSCSKLKRLRFLSNLQSLEELELIQLDELEDLGTEEDSLILPCLVSLYVSFCSNLKSLQYLHLPKLTTLFISASESIVQLPTSPNVTSLQIENTGTVLQGIAEFKKLRQLCLVRIYDTKSILEDVRHLTALQSLEMYYCDWPQDPDCIDKEGEEWSIISQIPRIRIDGQVHLKPDQPIHTTQVINLTTPGPIICSDDDKPVLDEVSNSITTEIEPEFKLSTTVDTTCYASMMTPKRLMIGFLILLSFQIGFLFVVIGGRWKIV